MTSTPRRFTLKRATGILLIVAAALLLVGLLFANYRAALALLAGFGIALLLLAAYRWLRQRIEPRWLIPGSIAGISILLCAAIGMVLISIGGFGATGVDEGGLEGVDTAPLIRAYRIYVQPSEERGIFLVQEELIYDMVADGNVLSSDHVTQLPPRQIKAEGKGFLLREVVINPPNPLYLTLPDGGEVTARLCLASCPPTTVELREFPENAFYAAREAAEVERIPYVNTETISWTTRHLDRGLAFTYIPAPFHAMRPVFGPLLGASSIGEWAAGLFGILSAMFAVPLLKPLVVDIAEDKAAEQIKRLRQRRKGGQTPDRT